jgi:prophage maintenance system killer protein
MSAPDDLSTTETQISHRLEALISSGDDSPETTAEKVRLLSRAAEILHERALDQYGGQHGIINGPTGSIAAAFQSGGGVDVYAGDFHKAAAMWRGITGDGNAFVDGNKRTGFLIAAYYLARAGWRSPLTPLPMAEVEAYGFSVAKRAITDVDEIAIKLQTWWMTWPDEG